MEAVLKRLAALLESDDASTDIGDRLHQLTLQARQAKREYVAGLPLPDQLAYQLKWDNVIVDSTGHRLQFMGRGRDGSLMMMRGAQSLQVRPTRRHDAGFYAMVNGEPVPKAFFHLNHEG